MADHCVCVWGYSVKHSSCAKLDKPAGTENKSECKLYVINNIIQKGGRAAYDQLHLGVWSCPGFVAYQIHT